MKIFLVEDEVFALRVLKQKILDLGHGYEIVGTAQDGSQALPAILETRPAVVITDIRMKDMDGLTLIQKLKEQGSSAIPVIVSGYQEFEYAKQAMKLGVEDYLLKPVELDKLEACLESCRRKAEKSYGSGGLNSFHIRPEDKLRLESIASDDPFLLAYLIFSTPLNNFESLLHPVTGYISRDITLNFFQKNMPRHSVFCFDGIISNEKIVLLNAPRTSTEETSAVFERLLPALADVFSFPVTAYCMPSPAKSFTYNLQTARRGCVRNAVLGVTRCAHSIPPSVPAENLTEFIDLLTLLIRQDDRELLRSNMQRLCMKWEKEQRTVFACQADLIFIVKALNQNFHQKKNRQLNSVFFVENVCCFCSSFQELAGDFSQLLLELFSASADGSERSLSAEELVGKIDRYFHENLSHGITLQMLAGEMKVSKVYLCRIFKKYKNMTPIDYFNRLKIDRACELLVQFSSLPLQKISDMLGFNDVYYFSKVFKKIVGVSPSVYRRDHCEK